MVIYSVSKFTVLPDDLSLITIKRITSNDNIPVLVEKDYYDNALVSFLHFFYLFLQSTMNCNNSNNSI